MAIQQLTLPGELVKKHNDLIRSKLHIDNALASKILASLIACIRSDEKEFSAIYSLQIKNFLTDNSGRGYKNIKDTCKELLYAHAEIEEIDNKNPYGHHKLSLIPFFREINYSNGIVSVQFNHNMHRLLLQLHNFFTEYNLIDYLKLPSIYSQRLFEILKSWENIKTHEVIIDVPKLHHMLNTPPSFQADFRQFRTRVLEKAHKDILAHTSLRFEWEPIKVGRSVESIRFTFGPGRRAIAEAEKKKAKEEKQRRLAKSRMIRASECAKAKHGECATMDNKPIVCKVCRQFQICEDLRKRGSTPFNPVC